MTGDLEPPPSTMAAQLINNISSVNQHIRPTEYDDLPSLMAEVSELEKNDTDSLSFEIKVQHKHKLIYVFARAVLDKLSKDDPFKNTAQLVNQASEALDIFISTVKEVPVVLGYALKHGEKFQSRGQELLWIWLFPKVLTLLGRHGCELLTEKIKDFFYVAFQAVARSPKLWNLSSHFYSYLKECATTLLEQLQRPALISKHMRLSVLLPTTQLDDFQLFQTTSVPLEYSSHCYFEIHDFRHGIHHISEILSMLVDVSMEAAASYDATPAFQDYLAWMLDTFLGVHEVQKKHRVSLDQVESDDGLQEMCFSAVHALVSTVQPFMSPMILRKSHFLLSILCADILSHPQDVTRDSTRFALCSCLLILSRAGKLDSHAHNPIPVHLTSAVTIAISDKSMCQGFGVDFKKAASLFCREFQIEINDTSFDDVSENFHSDELNTEFHRLDLISPGPHLAANNSYSPISKRRKISQPPTTLSQVTSELYMLLGHQKASDLGGLNQVAGECFSALSDDDRCRAIRCLSRIPCAADDTLILSTAQSNDLDRSACSLCDEHGIQAGIQLLNEKSKAISREAIEILTTLIQTSTFTNSRRPRVLAIFALQRFIVHDSCSPVLDLSVSPLGVWCVGSLRSSIRELRIAAGRTISFFLRNNPNLETVVQTNRVSIMSLLRTFSEKDSIYVQETCILAWGQVGRVVTDEGFVFVLLGLVKYLGHTNSVISGVAFNEILGLAKARYVTVARMFSPFWGTVAIEAVKNLTVRPQTTQHMADLLSISVSDFLVLTQTHTLPYLVLTKNIDVIRRISQARRDAEEFMTCFEPTNLVSILALLLQQNVPDMEEFVMSLLRAVSDRFRTEDLTDMMKIEPASTAFLLLIAAGDADDSKKSRIRFALQTLASRAPTSEVKIHKKGNPLGMFLEQHILGLVARFADLIIDPRGDLVIIERLRYIKGVEELVKSAKVYARIARPHLCLCLQSALSVVGLQAAAFSAWQAMLRNLDDEDVEVMLESTFSTVVQRWPDFDEKTQVQARDILKYLLKDRTRLLRNTIVNLPSLSGISALSEINTQLEKLRSPTDTGNAFQIFSRRLRNENAGVVYQALVELRAYLQTNQSFLQASAVSVQPDTVIGVLLRAILDTCIKFNESNHDVAKLCAECLGIIGSLDPNRVEAVREQREMIVLSNFHDADETQDFILYLLQEVIVPAFLSTTDAHLQGFYSYVMQQLLEGGEFKRVCGPIISSGDRSSTERLYVKWQTLSPNVQDTLTPFLSSKYTLKDMERPKHEYPMFRPDTMRSEKLYNFWLRAFVLDLLQKPFTNNTQAIYLPLTRAIRIKDISIANFLLPYLVLHAILDGTDQNRREIGEELLCILRYEAPPESRAIRREDIKLCVEAVFRVLDYLSRWIQRKQSQANQSRVQGANQPYVELIQSVVNVIPAEIMSQRAIECKSYSRALFYWEQHIRQSRALGKRSPQDPELLERLQEIYTQIDEPDGIEGISAHLHVLDIEQQILAHRKAGRWTAAQSWYEIKLAEQPDDLDVQLNLLTCLKESGQHDVLLNYVEGMHTAATTVSPLLPFAVEASWATGRWAALEKYTSMAAKDIGDDFNIRIGQALLALHNTKDDTVHFKSIVSDIREKIGCSLSTPMTASLVSSHDTMLKLHVLTELEMIAGTDVKQSPDRSQILESLNRRLEVIGAYLNDKQYLLSIRRAAMKLSNLRFTQGDIAEAWLTSARLARKGNAIHQSFNAVLHASQLGDDSAKIEHARLLWREGHHRKAIQSLQGAIDSNAFISHNKNVQSISFTEVDSVEQQNLLTARAHLMLAKWKDAAGQTQSAALRQQYQVAARTHINWEKGHYYLGRHYNKLLESEKALPADQQKDSYITGETSKLVIENYLRALNYGTKYLYQTLPRILTLWLDLGAQVAQPLDTKSGHTKEFVARVNQLRKQYLDQLHQRFVKYIAKMPAYMFYTALPQILSRIAHPNQDVYKFLHQIILKVVTAYPQHSLWNVLAVCCSNQPERKNRGTAILQALQSSKKVEAAIHDTRSLVKNGVKLSEQLALSCNAGDFQGNRTTWAHLSRDLGFVHKSCTPSMMAVPFESVLTAALPTLTSNVKSHKAFSRDVVTISSFDDEVMVLSSLQKPRKLTARGSDGRSYGLMCKPKDDLRKDQRLMEFNSMINRALKRDAEASRRQLYIKTYAVTPLNEECGLIEWVDGLKTLRDILLGLYKTIGIQPNYREIETYCEHALKSDDNLIFYTEKVLNQFPPVFHKWFVQQFPEPSAWFAARLRYTRSCAVMSMVGTILGLGDRHGENILFEEGNGGTFHVDFNCLFDKGLTFVKPERVPFRLTHNMIDAMGMYGYEGPFRKSSELTLSLLRQHEETLMTILEAFVYDPTLDLLAKKPDKKKKESQVAQTPQGVLDAIQRKVKGRLPGETVPLGVEGQVEELIKQATNLSYLAGMYIGWCSFL